MIDIFAELLLHLKIDAAPVAVFHAGRRWGMSTAVLPSAALGLYALLDDQAILSREGMPDQRLARGDIVLLRADATVGLSSDGQARRIPFMDIWRRQKLPQDLHARSRRGGPTHYGPGEAGGAPRLLTIAYVLHQPESSALLGMLDEVSVLPAAASSMPHFLPAMLDWLTHESSAASPGFAGPGTKMAELILTGFIRDYLLGLPQERQGWLSALRDARMGKALTAIHAAPERPWSLVSLAAEATMSRASFAAKFQAMLGKPPMAYLSEQRMKQAGAMISTRRTSVAATAEHFGYRSEAAFRVAFRKYWGYSPREHTRDGA